jgi:hypothetical protein
MTSNPPEPKVAAPVAPAQSERSVGELFTDAVDDLTMLVKHEVALAKAELRFSVRNGGLAAGLLGAAAFLLLLSIIMLSVAFAYLIHLSGLDLAWCFLIVWFVYTLLAALLGYIGSRRFKYVRAPNRAIEQAKETKETLLRR